MPSFELSRAIAELIRQTLEDSGHSLSLQVSGGSMRPTLRPSDKIEVDAVPIESLRVGDIIALRLNSCYRVHRFICWQDNFQKIVCRGDFGYRSDLPRSASLFVGKVRSRNSVFGEEQLRFLKVLGRQELKRLKVNLLEYCFICAQYLPAVLQSFPYSCIDLRLRAAIEKVEPAVESRLLVDRKIGTSLGLSDFDYCFIYRGGCEEGFFRASQSIRSILGGARRSFLPIDSGQLIFEQDLSLLAPYFSSHRKAVTLPVQKASREILELTEENYSILRRLLSIERLFELHFFIASHLQGFSNSFSSPRSRALCIRELRKTLEVFQVEIPHSSAVERLSDLLRTKFASFAEMEAALPLYIRAAVEAIESFSEDFGLSLEHDLPESLPIRGERRGTILMAADNQSLTDFIQLFEEPGGRDYDTLLLYPRKLLALKVLLEETVEGDKAVPKELAQVLLYRRLATCLQLNFNFLLYKSSHRAKSSISRILSLLFKQGPSESAAYFNEYVREQSSVLHEKLEALPQDTPLELSPDYNSVILRELYLLVIRLLPELREKTSQQIELLSKD